MANRRNRPALRTRSERGMAYACTLRSVCPDHPTAGHY
jgi:hypothetical protein